jgi:hypothetical protein
MQNQSGFIVKLIFLSTVISLLIKYGGQSLTIPVTTANAIVMILLPTLIMAALLLWRRLIDKRERENLF